MYQFPDLGWAAVGGILPAFFWLWFWLREDQHPEPRRILALCFLGGMMATLAAIPLEAAVAKVTAGAPMLLAWAFIEEALKLIVAYFAALRLVDFDEPVDALVYVITVALGFAAVENILFIVKALGLHGTYGALLIGNIRFIGATLVHIVSSAVIGAAISLSFYKARRIKAEAALAGLILAAGLHAMFNFFIIQSDGRHLWPILFTVWICVLFLIAFFERVKTLASNPTSLPTR